MTADASTLLIVGDGRPEHVGAHFLHAAREMGLNVHFADCQEAAGSGLAGKISWRLLGRRPARLASFSRKIVDLCRELKPGVVFTTGFAPIAAESLQKLGDMGVYRVNYLTDDPANPAQRAPWFLRAIRNYDEVLSTRRANLSELRESGCRKVRHLPFGYAPYVHFEEQLSPARRRELQSDVMFAGFADADRLPYITALKGAGFRLALYGAYWERFPETQSVSRGYGSLAVLREAVAAASVAICLVRRANRDGSCMRTFEVPAMGGCMLVEKTDEHVELFGPEGETVLYFDGIPEMTAKVAWLLEHNSERERLREAAHQLISRGKHTYRDRLECVLRWATDRSL